jgi:hypothetical protein
MQWHALVAIWRSVIPDKPASMKQTNVSTRR